MANRTAPDGVSKPTVSDEIERFLREGAHDHMYFAWPGQNFQQRAGRGDRDLREALIAAVRERTAGAAFPEPVRKLDVVAFTRDKVAPMVRGLFPAKEQELVLDLLARSVVFLTPESIETVLLNQTWLRTAWDLANLYLAGCGAELLSPDVPRIVGISIETTCYVTKEYFDEDDPFADFVVHEAAHIFHNCKRERVGLPGTRRREWLLEIDFAKRETFAYACEAYSRIRALGARPAEWATLVERLKKGPMPPDDRVDPDEYLDVLRQAVAARNGWKQILSRCSRRDT